MYKCTICKSDCSYDEFADYKNEVCINCEEEYEDARQYVADYAEDYAHRKGEWK